MNGLRGPSRVPSLVPSLVPMLALSLALVLAAGPASSPAWARPTPAQAAAPPAPNTVPNTVAQATPSTAAGATDPAAAPAAPGPAGGWGEMAPWVQLAQDDPEAALEGLQALAARGAAARPLALARGLVAAAAGRADLQAQALAALDALPADPLAAADAALVRAAWADAAEDALAALEAARKAATAYAALCPGTAGCDHRPHWQALQLLARQDRRRGLSSAALAHALAAHALASQAGDRPHQALALALAADAAGLMGDAAAEQLHLAQAQALARAEGDPVLRSRVLTAETRLHRRRGDLPAARRVAEAGLALARQGGSSRLESGHLANLADVLVALDQPRAALQAVQAALPMAQRLGDRRLELTLMHNAALAHIALRQTEAARREMDKVLAAYREGGATADHAQALREFGDAYAAAGNLPEALKLFHAERALAAEMMAANRDAALAALRQRFDREAQQRRIEQLGRERTLVNAQLDNRAALQQVWAAAGVVLLLAGVLVALMYRRVRRLRRRLEDNQARLREQSRREPLTGLHNRRGLHETLQARGLTTAFEGALLLLDIDHFKRINDQHGHAAGDAVLVETARRVREALREDSHDGDLVVRWGGEEFIVCLTHAPAGTPAQRDSSGSAAAPEACARRAQALARRVLDAIGGEAFVLADGSRLRVTVSLGHACFPLAPARLPLPLERAINLVDMALYTAKNQGRNCALGIAETQASTAAALAAVEADFDLARSEGRVRLERLAGPAAASAEPSAPHASPHAGAHGSTAQPTLPA